MIGALRGTQHVVKRAAISRTRHRLQPFSTKGARCGADARFFSSWTAAVRSQATGRGFESPRRQAQAGSGGRCAKDRARARRGKKINLSSPLLVLAEGKKINLAVGAQWHSEKKRKEGQVRSWGGASRSDPRSAADPQGVGRTGLSSAHLVLHPPSPRSYGPSIHLRSGSFAAGGEPVKGLWHPSHYEARRASPLGI